MALLYALSIHPRRFMSVELVTIVAVSSVIASVFGAGIGGRVVFMALERKLDDRYKPRPEVEKDEQAQDGRLDRIEKSLAKLEGLMQENQLDRQQTRSELEELERHVNNTVLKALDGVTTRLEQMHEKQEAYLRVQERHATVMESHAKALAAFQQWFMHKAGVVSILPILGEET